MSSPVALITGASRGIGRATAIALARLGYRLALVARSERELRETAALTGAAASDVLTLPADVTNASQVEAIVRQAADHFGRLDAVVNVAGVAPMQTIEQTSVETWHAVLNTNLSSAFYVTKYAWPHLRQTATTFGRKSAVVNVSSMSARDPFAGFAAYGAAKAALNVFSLVAAREGQAENISVHTIAPGAVETAMFRQIMTPEQYPPEKTLAPDEVADLIAQCVTGRLASTAGEVLYVRKTL